VGKKGLAAVIDVFHAPRRLFPSIHVQSSTAGELKLEYEYM
jgi:hypothetical protein